MMMMGSQTLENGKYLNQISEKIKWKVCYAFYAAFDIFYNLKLYQKQSKIHIRSPARVPDVSHTLPVSRI